MQNIISHEDLQLFQRLKKMIDATTRLECAGCQKLISTLQFYDHLLDQSDDQDETENQQNYNNQELHLCHPENISEILEN